MVGPILIHQKKIKETYKHLPTLIIKQDEEFRNLRSFDTDGENSLAAAFSEVSPSGTQLRCFVHFKNNIKDYLKKIGASEKDKINICADIFGQQIATKFEEGIVDAEDAAEFYTWLDTLKLVWQERLGEKGLQFHSYFMKIKTKEMEHYMLKSVKVKAGLGNPPTSFSKNRIEPINNMLKVELGKEQPVDVFVKNMRNLVERQTRNIIWTLIDKGPHKLHPNLSHMLLDENVWYKMGVDERKQYIQMFLECDVLDTTPPANTISEATLIRAIAIDKQKELDETLPYGQLEDKDFDNMSEQTPQIRAAKDNNIFSYSLNILADAACRLNTNANQVKKVLSIPLEDFQLHLPNLPSATSQGIYEKAAMLLNKPNTVVNAPGSDQISRIVESTSKKDRPHLVTKGKAQGEFKWKRNCPHFNGLKICLDSVVTAHCNGMLRDFMVFLEKKKVNVNVSSTVRTDMPQMPGKKGGQVGRKRSLSQLSVDERVKRNYSSSVANVNSFYVKKMNSRIRIFQGCRGLLILEDGSIPGSPYNYCFARREQRPYFDKNTNTKKNCDKRNRLTLSSKEKLYLEC